MLVELWPGEIVRLEEIADIRLLYDESHDVQRAWVIVDLIRDGQVSSVSTKLQVGCLARSDHQVASRNIIRAFAERLRNPP